MPSTTLEELYKNLEQYKNLETEGHFDQFFDTLDQIALRQDLSSLPVLAKYIDDNCPYDYLQECLIRIFENFNSNDYICFVLKNLDHILKNGSDFVSSLLIRILNSEEHFSILKKYIHLANDASLVKILQSIAKDADQFKNYEQKKRIAELLHVLGDSS